MRGRESRHPHYSIMSFIKVIILIAVAVFIAIATYGNLDGVQAAGSEFAGFVLLAMQLCLGTGVFAVAVVGVWCLRRSNHEQNRQRDGAFAPRDYWLEPWTVRLFNPFRGRINRKATVDINMMLSPGFIVADGTILQIEPAGGWDRQLDYAKHIEKTRRIQAAVVGDGVRSLPWSNIGERSGGVANAATGRMLTGYYDPRERPLPSTRQIEMEPKVAPNDPPRLLTYKAAIESATPERWIAGQNNTGALAIFDPIRYIHAGVIGSTGTGKTTSIGYSLVAQALRTGYHPIIFDPKGGADWSPWANHAEWHETDATVFPDQVAALWAEHERRVSLLREAGASTIADLPDEVRPVRLLPVLEEYGDLISQLRRCDRKVADATDNTLDRLLRLSRATGIHLLLIDQYPEQWHPQVVAGVRWLAVFKLGPNQGNKVQEHSVGRPDFPDRGVFVWRKEQYDAWNARPVLRQLQAMTPASRFPRVIDGVCSVLTEQPNGETICMSSGQPNTPPNAMPNGLTERPADKRELIFWWLDRNPTGTQAEFRHYLDQQGESIARGYISDCFAEWHAKRQGEIDAALATDSFSLEHLRTMLETGMDVRIIGKDIGSQR